MMVWLAAILAGLTMAGLLYLWRSRNPKWQLAKLKRRLERLKQSNGSSGGKDKLLKAVYDLVSRGIEAKDAQLTYQALDLLKLAYGSGLVRAKEHDHLQSVMTRAMRDGQADLAGLVLDVYPVLIKRASDAAVTEVLDQLLAFLPLCVKNKQHLLTAKVIDNIFLALDCLEANNFAANTLWIRSLKAVGLLAIKKRDQALFREINQRLYNNNAFAAHQEEGVVPALLAWLQGIVKKDDQELYQVWQESLLHLYNGRVISAHGLRKLWRECQKAAGTASLNPYSQMAAKILDTTLRLPMTEGDMELFKIALSGGRQTAALAINRYGLEQGFQMMFPLFDVGRDLLLSELRFGGYARVDNFRQKAMSLLFKEYTLLMEMAARQDITATAGDIIADLAKVWLAYSDALGSKKSIHKFCQLLFLYWLKQRQPKRSYVPPEIFAQTPNLTATEQAALQFLLDTDVLA